MEHPSPHLKDLLQVQLASDSYAVLHLPFVLETLTKSDFSPSAHTQKWIARVNSLVHSKDPAARWCGLCLAHQTAILSRDIMLECAQSWVGAAMPLLMVCSLPYYRKRDTQTIVCRTSLRLRQRQPFVCLGWCSPGLWTSQSSNASYALRMCRSSRTPSLRWQRRRRTLKYM